MKRIKPSLFINIGAIILFMVLTVLLTPGTIQAKAAADVALPQAEGEALPITIYVFRGEGCPHCADEEVFLADLIARYPNVKVMDYETWYDADNQALFNQIADAYDFKPQGVPTTFVGDQYVVGFNDNIATQIEDAVKYYMELGTYPDPMDRLKPEPEATPRPTPQPIDVNSTQIDVPLFGNVDLKNYSLLASTLLISLIDGFNPCSLWVLSMLIALSLHTGSRKKVFIIGFVFLTVTAAVYAVFILGLFSVMSIIKYVGWIQVIVSLVAAFFALINIKDYFWYKEGLSLTIADDKKPGIFKKMRNVVNASNNIWATIGATIVLAVGVSLVEFSCTAGLPMLWTNLLNTQGVTPLTFGLLLLVYMLIYQLDELIIFVPAALTLRSSKFEEKQGRLLKLIGGIIMLVLAFVLLINPAWLNNIGNTLLIFAIAIGITLLVLFLHKVVLPEFGIYIGSDQKPSRSGKKYKR